MKKIWNKLKKLFTENYLLGMVVGFGAIDITNGLVFLWMDWKVPTSFPLISGILLLLLAGADVWDTKQQEKLNDTIQKK